MYQFPECDSDEDEEFKQLDKELKVSLVCCTCGYRFRSSYFLFNKCMEKKMQTIWLSSMQSGADHQAHTPAVVSVNSVEG